MPKTPATTFKTDEELIEHERKEWENQDAKETTHDLQMIGAVLIAEHPTRPWTAWRTTGGKIVIKSPRREAVHPPRTGEELLKLLAAAGLEPNTRATSPPSEP